jgi:hypothetical protein
MYAMPRRWSLVCLLLVGVLLLPLCCRSVLREIIWRPDIDDRSGLSEAFISDSGLLLMCGAVTDAAFMRKATARGDEQTLVQRSYTLTLFLGDSPGLGSTLEQIDIESHPTLKARRGGGACDFEAKRESLFPEEKNWVRIGMAWVGNDRVSAERIRNHDLPLPKEGQRATLYMVQREMGTVYLFVGRATPSSPYRNLLLRLGKQHIETLWRGGVSNLDTHREVHITHWGRYGSAPTIARQKTGYGPVAVVDPHAPPVLREQATALQVRLGDRIGIQYEALGISERATFPVEIQVHHPPIGGQRVSRWKAFAQGGVALYTGWRFQLPCQLIPGAWLFEVHHAGDVLAAKEFMITIAPGQPDTDGCPKP